MKINLAAHSEPTKMDLLLPHVHQGTIKLTQKKGIQGVPWVGDFLFFFFRVNLKFGKFTIPLLVIS